MFSLLKNSHPLFAFFHEMISILLSKVFLIWKKVFYEKENLSLEV